MHRGFDRPLSKNRDLRHRCPARNRAPAGANILGHSKGLPPPEYINPTLNDRLRVLRIRGLAEGLPFKTSGSPFAARMTSCDRTGRANQYARLRIAYPLNGPAMSRKKVDSRFLRQIAEGVVDRIAVEVDLPDSERGDFVTSLVRQWITYDGNATFFVDETRQFYLALGTTPLGKPRVMPEPVPPGWSDTLYGDWKIRPDDMPEIIDHLNLGQGAEVVNADGLPLRLWVNPKERSQGVEALAPEAALPPTPPDYRRFAADALAPHLGGGLDQAEMDDLAFSVTKQWQRYDGHACVFLNERRGIAIRVTTDGDGNSRVEVRQVTVNVVPELASYGIPPEGIPEVLARFNLDQAIEIRDRTGRRFCLWHDPKAGRLCVRPLDVAGRMRGAMSPPVLCPGCSAVLRPWRDGERRQSCQLCGLTVSLP